MYNIVYLARHYEGLFSFKKLIDIVEEEDIKAEMINYIEYNTIEERRVKINEVTKKVCLSLENEFRIDNSSFLKKR